MLTAPDVGVDECSRTLESVPRGRAPNGIMPDRMGSGGRAARNQLLKDMMRDNRYLENMGMGIPRKIVKGMKEHNGTQPDLIEMDERFIVRLHAKASE